MGLFRPYERTEPKDKAHKKASAATSTKRESSKQSPPPEEASDTKPAGKSGPTPKRRESEAARWEQLHPKQSKRQQRAESRRKERDQRLKAMELAEKAPERVLARNYVDARWTFAEFTMPVFLILLALSFLGNVYPQIVYTVAVFMWLVLLLLVGDLIRLWRGYKREYNTRYDKPMQRGMMMYLVNRTIQIRRWRVPGASIKRGDKY